MLSPRYTILIANRNTGAVRRFTFVRRPVLLLMAGLLILSRLVVDLRSGVTSSNWGTWRRDENRVEFRRNICFWIVITLLWFVLGIFTVFGWVRLPST